MTSKQLADKIAQGALDKKGKEIVILDLRKLTDMADYFVLISGESDIHVKTISNHLEKELKEDRIQVWHKEGYSNLNWVLLDLIDVVVHIFRPEAREYYGLEKLWADAKMTRVKEDATTGMVSSPTN